MASHTLNLFVSTFPMPDGTTRRPLVERVTEIAVVELSDDLGAWVASDYVQAPIRKPHAESLLIRAAHEWYATNRLPFASDLIGKSAWNHMHMFCDDANVAALVLACHLIADAMGVGE